MKLAVKFWQNVKTANRNLLPLLLSLVLLTTAAAAKTLVHPGHETDSNPTAKNFLVEPSASFERLWIDYDITQGGIKGMRIHVKFKVYDMKGIDGYLAVYFQQKDGTPLKDNNGKFNSADDTVAVYQDIAPGYQTTVYEDYTVFMPYSEMDLRDGDYNLKLDVDVIYKEGGLVDHLTFYDFVYNQGAKKKPSVEFDNVRVDYDVTQGGQRGMKIHAKLTVVNMMGIDGYVGVFFQKKGGTKLMSPNRAFRSGEGQLAVYFDISPGYDRTVYEDATFFLPYSELEATLPRGNFELQMDVDVIYKNGDLVQHLTFEDFWFDRK
jgi:hypothetical protein